MSRYLIIIGLFLVSIAQVAWAPFLIFKGVVIPIQLLYLWLLSSKLEFGESTVLAFIAGIITDLMGPSELGRQALSLLLAVGLFRLIEQRTLYSVWVSRLVSLVVGIGFYLLILRGLDLLFSI